MYEDKSARNAVKSSFSLPANRNSMLKKALRTSRRDARLAVMQEKMLTETAELCIQAYVLHAVRKLKFLLNLRKASQSIAASALQKKTRTDLKKSSHCTADSLCFDFFNESVYNFFSGSQNIKK